MRIDWYGNVLYPQEILLQTLKLTRGAIENLREGTLSSALRKLYQVDNNAYAFMFDEDVYSHFTDYVFNQPRERLKWGYGRLMPHKNLYALVKSLLQKKTEPDADVQEEIDFLEDICRRQCDLLAQTVGELQDTVQKAFLRPPAEEH